MLDLNINLINALNAYFSTNGFLNLKANMKDMNKNNVVLHGIEVRDEIKKQAVIYYMQEKDEEVIDLARKLIRLAQEMPEFSIYDILDADYIRMHVKPRLVAAETGNEQNPILEGKSVFPIAFLDMRKIYYIELQHDTDGVMSVPVTDQIIKEAGVDIYDIDFWANMNIEDDIEYMSMLKMLASLQGYEYEEEDSPIDHDMFVLTLKSRLHGAAAITLANTLYDISEQIGCNYYILPSSTHEVIIVADRDNNPTAEKIEEFYNMVKSVNATQVAPEDRLTDTVYYYSKNNGIEIAA